MKLKNVNVFVLLFLVMVSSVGFAAHGSEKCSKIGFSIEYISLNEDGFSILAKNTGTEEIRGVNLCVVNEDYCFLSDSNLTIKPGKAVLFGPYEYFSDNFSVVISSRECPVYHIIEINKDSVVPGIMLNPVNYILVDPSTTKEFWADISMWNGLSVPIKNITITMSINSLGLSDSETISEIPPKHWRRLHQLRLLIPPNTSSNEYEIRFDITYYVNGVRKEISESRIRHIIQVNDARCEDRDGNDYYVKGNATIYLPTGYQETFYDYCYTPTLLSEAICEGNVLRTKIVSCPDGCQNGACVAEEGKYLLCSVKSFVGGELECKKWKDVTDIVSNIDNKKTTISVGTKILKGGASKDIEIIGKSFSGCLKVYVDLNGDGIFNDGLVYNKCYGAGERDFDSIINITYLCPHTSEGVPVCDREYPLLFVASSGKFKVDYIGPIKEEGYYWCKPSFLNSETGENDCEEWTDVKERVSKVDGEWVTLSYGAPVMILKVITTQSELRFKADTAHNENACMKILADTDLDGKFESEVDTFCGKGSVDELVYIDKEYINKPLLFIPTDGVFYVDYLSPQCYSNADCPEGSFCEFPVGECRGPGVCVYTPNISNCRLAPPSPVCGCDNITYQNECYRKASMVSKRSDGACIPEENLSCLDSDSGLDYFTKGVVTYKGETYEDYCSSDSKVVEYFCRNGEVERTGYRCPNGCYDGACMEFEWPAGFDQCEYGGGWSEPRSAAERCGWPPGKEGYVRDCCCCYLTAHVHDLGEHLAGGQDVEIKYMPGFYKGCCSPMYVYYSLDGETWKLFYTKVVTQETWHPKTIYTDVITVPNDFRYIKIEIPKCYIDFSSVKVLGVEETKIEEATKKMIVIDSLTQSLVNDVYKVYVYIRDTGTKEVECDELGVYINGYSIDDFDCIPKEIQPGDIGAIVFERKLEDGDRVKVSAPGNYDEITYTGGITSNATLPTIPEEKPCDNGCYYIDKCVPFGTRLMINNESVYCDIDGGLKKQKEEGEACMNNYECKSNFCSNGKCYNIVREMKETKGLLEKIIEFFKKLFGFWKK